MSLSNNKKEAAYCTESVQYAASFFALDLV